MELLALLDNTEEVVVSNTTLYPATLLDEASLVPYPSTTLDDFDEALAVLYASPSLVHDVEVEVGFVLVLVLHFVEVDVGVVLELHFVDVEVVSVLLHFVEMGSAATKAEVPAIARERSVVICIIIKY